MEATTDNSFWDPAYWTDAFINSLEPLPKSEKLISDPPLSDEEGSYRYDPSADRVGSETKPIFFSTKIMPVPLS